MANVAKTAKKNSSKKNSADRKNGNGRVRQDTPLHKKILSLMNRPNGATLHDTWKAGWPFPVMAAVKLVERRGYKVSRIKKDGELTRYVAKPIAKRSSSSVGR